MSGQSVYRRLKQEMWRESVRDLENFGGEKEDQRVEANEKEVEEIGERVQLWEGKAKL